MQNEAHEVKPPHECSCGKFYLHPDGPAICAGNRHGRNGSSNSKDGFLDTYRFGTDLVTTVSVTCAECGEWIGSHVTRDRDGDINVKAVRHVCQIDAPE
jgi:hypothetical protein